MLMVVVASMPLAIVPLVPESDDVGKLLYPMLRILNSIDTDVT
jgi:hypothetical protein